jgi:hypothetical protein
LKRFCLLSLFSGLSSSAFFGVFCWKAIFEVFVKGFVEFVVLVVAEL